MTKDEPYNLSVSARAEEKFFENRIADETTLSDAEKEWLTTDEAANFLGISPATLRNQCSDGRVPYYKWQRRNRYRTNELRTLLLATKRGGSHGY